MENCSSGNCNNCVYGRLPRIPASVPKKARIAIVGEAPGPKELTKKQPFIGPSGELVKHAFDKLGLPMEEVFITNALLCRPPSGKPIKREAVEMCRARLLEELKYVQPELVIAFGNTPMHALTGDFKKKITVHQGRLLEDTLLGGDVKVVAAFHPAAILRDGSKLPYFEKAVKKASDIFHGKAVEPPPMPSFTVCDTPELVDRAINGLVKQEYLVADIETSGDPEDGRILSLGVCWKDGRVLIFPEEVLPTLTPLFENPNPKWVWHHGKYDIAWLIPRGLPARLDEDTMMLHYALNENPGTHDLEQLATQMLNDRPWKHLIDKYTKGFSKKYGYANVPKDVLYRYHALDCDRTRRLFKLLYPQVMMNPDLKRLYYDLLLPASRFLMEVQKKGMLPSPSELEVLGGELQEAIQQRLEDIQELVKFDWNPEEYACETGAKSFAEKFNPGSVKQLRWLLYDKLKVKQIKKKGQSTEGAVLEMLADKHPVIQMILEYRSLKKLYGTYVKGIIERTHSDGRVHPTFNVHGTVTGRLSCTDPNVQNVPKSMRKVYVAPPGYKLVQADYSGAELRVLAYVSDDDFMREVFEQGRDLHAEVQQALNIERIKAKTINFGIPYGRTPESIAEEFGIPTFEAKKMVADWFKRAPKVEEYLLGCDGAAKNGQVLTTPLGRHRRFGLVSSENVEDLTKEARNFRIQSIASDMTLISGITMAGKLREKDAWIVNLVHDSILVETPEEHVDFVVHTLFETMRQVPKDWLQTTIPFEVEVEVGDSWGAMTKVSEG